MRFLYRYTNPKIRMSRGSRSYLETSY